ncbi:MAG: hypothetical protein AABX59_00675 [Nanoarchaeota archaeon]
MDKKYKIALGVMIGLLLISVITNLYLLQAAVIGETHVLRYEKIRFMDRLPLELAVLGFPEGTYVIAISGSSTDPDIVEIDFTRNLTSNERNEIIKVMDTMEYIEYQLKTEN